MRNVAYSLIFAAIAALPAQAASSFENVAVDPQRRAQLMAALPDRLADFAADEAVIACLYAAEIGDDASLLALEAIDLGRRVIKIESDLVRNAYAAGATAKELLALRTTRATPERKRQVATATRQLQEGQSYCEEVRKALDKEQVK